MPVQTVIKVRRDTAANWTSTNPVLAAGEMGLETDTSLVKYGDGTSAWSELVYPAASNTTYLVRNDTGSTIPKGTLVAASGAEPSGRIDVAPFEVTGVQDSELRVMGLAMTSISDGHNGTVMSFGTLKNIDTRGNVSSAIAVGDETWAAGDILYAHPTVDGKLTNVRPQHDLAIAFITIRHQSAGQIAIRINPGNNHLEWMHDVALSSPANKQVLQYDSATSLWKNATISAGVTVSDTAPSSPSVGDQWYNSVEGRTYVYYDSFWVDSNPGLVGPAGADGVDGVDGVDGGFNSTQTIASLASGVTLSSVDVGKLFTGGGATVTVQGLSVGQQVDFVQTSSTQITFAAGSGMTLNSKGGLLKTAAQYSPATIKCVATNTYILLGDLGA